MLTKFETRSNRVKGLSFHPKRPWILASLHNGVIQLWDYKLELLIDKFEEHEGPVRGVDFHPTQPLFVSGGDDFKIKVWNYTSRRCLFNLLGHLDYIRTVQFHHEHPWILSCSDDQTIRIWNWQSRQCLSVITGHNHYVMSAHFHPRENLILSASLDQTVRIWDFTGLRKKHVVAGASANRDNQDIFGGSDVVVKHVLEGHSRGVNWASFHKNSPLISSGADDREIKIWRWNDNKAWEVETLRGHTNNVCCTMFHPRRELLLTAGEDKCIKIWDMTKQQVPQTWKRESDRFWIMVSHPSLNMIAAGHDSGFVIFKLERERPAMDVNVPLRQLFYFRDRFIRMFDHKSGKDIVLATIRRAGSVASTNIPRTMHYNCMNPSEHNILLHSTNEGGSYELYTFKKTESGTAGVGDDSGSAMRGTGLAAVFTSRTRLAVLENGSSIALKNLQNETKRKIPLPFNNANMLFPATIGHVLIRTPESVCLFELEGRQLVNKITTLVRHPIKYVVWSKNHKYVALLSKFLIYICDNQLNELCMLNETSRLKSAAWDPAGVLVYTTASHIKYCLTNGDTGVIRTLDVPIYMTSVNPTSLSCIDREMKVRDVPIDNSEYMFKFSLLNRRYIDALKIMQSRKLIGKAIIGYLHKKGFPEIALHFVQDTKTKFSLALECGNIRVALQCAEELNAPECWHKLGVEALRQGNHQIVEMCYQKTKNFERLSFLYLMTGNTDKLSKMLHIAQLRNDPLSRFHNSLFLGNVSERVQVLKETGQLKLAYLTAKTHGLDDEAQAIAELLGDDVPALPDLSNASLLQPPTPILREGNWPQIEVAKDIFEDAESMIAASAPAPVEEDDPMNSHMPGFDDDLPSLDMGMSSGRDASSADAGGSGWDLGLDLDIPVDSESVESKPEMVGTGSDSFFLPTLGASAAQKWGESSSVPGVLVAAGYFDMAMHVLNSQAGFVNFEPLKSLFLQAHQSTYLSLPTLPNLSSVVSPIRASISPDLPVFAFNINHCVDKLKLAYKSVTDGKFAQALEQFLSILHTIPLINIENKSQAKEVNDLLNIAREYVTALRIELLRKDEANPARQFELACYFTKCELQPIHVFLGLRVAIKCGYTIKNFKTTANLCRRLLELSVSAKLPPALTQGAEQIKNILKACEKVNTDTEPIRLDDRAFSICCSTFAPIYRNQVSVNCPYCHSAYVPNADGSVCSTCLVAKVGVAAEGLTMLKQ